MKQAYESPVIVSKDPPRVIRDALFAHEVLRRLGFAAADIFIAYGNIDGMTNGVGVVLRTQGKEWIWTIGSTPLAGDAFSNAWETWLRAWNAAPLNANLWGYRDSRIFREAPLAVASIVTKGIHLPCVQTFPRKD